jgi:6-pyruvoyltetrahydropterin/6-carboxytetrahydropterin synthase
MNRGMYEVGTSREVRAYHTMPGMPPPEGERHSHDYRLDIRVTRPRLDERDMVVDLDVLNDALRGVTDRLHEADLDEIVGKETAKDAVTVEVFSQWLHAVLADAVGPVSGATLHVRVWEDPQMYGGYEGPLGD